jgi:hypothetical protein
MKSLRNYLLFTALFLFCIVSALAQTPTTDAKQFTKDGLTFSYPTGWVLNDTSNADAQQLVVGRPNSERRSRSSSFAPL